MKLSSVLVQGLLLCGIIASPVVTTPDADNSTDISAQGFGAKYELCFDENQGRYCTGKSVKACARAYETGKDHYSPKDATNACNFWCSKIKTLDDCRTNKKKFNYHPKWGCKDQMYSCLH
ncbi:putative secreted protein [Wickerhamomyces ciferrii]|uniref:Secreted protein n=1 Tax=Wickerhamomyces ciferrii (strain ATCC 14091 / BCRC 22168 / CBS 111 / JCM 3599 / NBRC 0793 / NRRL Y-1031 F-60-10) TaxID=1206466 RepID=K0KZH2_WICCF|nr:uncharacterized protein BN7_6126 [Wickerhamomyces ciferrii]CCH46533.1 putative secreted protein [Wickerhamomyces ciferrii]